jgi:hypothetical protein
MQTWEIRFMENNKQVTFERVMAGQFAVLLNGARTEYQIVNGSLGVSGYGQNVYGIVKDGASPRWIGTLQACKKIMTFTLTKQGA